MDPAIQRLGMFVGFPPASTRTSTTTTTTTTKAPTAIKIPRRRPFRPSGFLGSLTRLTPLPGWSFQLLQFDLLVLATVVPLAGDLGSHEADGRGDASTRGVPVFGAATGDLD